jgi:hypothetical protein
MPLKSNLGGDTVAEKLSALHIAKYFVGRAANGSLSRFDEIMARQGGEVPVAGDER